MTDMNDAPATLDLAHLDRQTMGDLDLRREVLAMFLVQAETAAATIGGLSEAELRMAAHTLKGSARSIGAFAIAAFAERIERQGLAGSDPAALHLLIDEVRAASAA